MAPLGTRHSNPSQTRTSLADRQQCHNRQQSRSCLPIIRRASPRFLSLGSRNHQPMLSVDRYGRRTHRHGLLHPQRNGYKWVKMDISHAPHHQYHDHPPRSLSSSPRSTSSKGAGRSLKPSPRKNSPPFGVRAESLASRAHDSEVFALQYGASSYGCRNDRRTGVPS